MMRAAPVGRIVPGRVRVFPILCFCLGVKTIPVKTEKVEEGLESVGKEWYI